MPLLRLQQKSLNWEIDGLTAKGDSLSDGGGTTALRDIQLVLTRAQADEIRGLFSEFLRNFPKFNSQ